MLYKQIKSIPKATILQKLREFYIEDEINEDKTSNTYINPM